MVVLFHIIIAWGWEKPWNTSIDSISFLTTLRSAPHDGHVPPLVDTCPASFACWTLIGWDPEEVHVRPPWPGRVVASICRLKSKGFEFWTDGGFGVYTIVAKNR